jgi:hypothetical protein
MVGCFEYAIKIILKAPIFPRHWDNFFYEYFNLRERGRSRQDAKAQAMKMTMWKYKNES